MNQFVEVISSGWDCDACGRKQQEGEKAYVMVTEDSIEYLCHECGDYCWRFLEVVVPHPLLQVAAMDTIFKTNELGKEVREE